MLTSTTRLVALASAALAMAAAPSPARAQSAAEAEQLFRDGERLMGEKKYAEACAAFEASEHIDPNPVSLWKLADCREKNGQLATAWGHFVAVAQKTRGDAGRATVHRTANDRAAALAPRLSYLTIDVPADRRIEGLAIARNGAAVEPGAWGRALPVDGGTYVITASAPGHASSSTRIAVAAAGDKKAVEVPALAPVPAASETTVSEREAPPDDGSIAAPPAEPAIGRTDDGLADVSPRRSRVLPILVGATAVVALGAAVGFEVSARSTYDDAKVEIDDARQDDLWRSAKTRRYVAEGLAAGGVCLAVAATWLYLRGDREANPTAVSVTPVTGPEVWAGIAVGGAW